MAIKLCSTLFVIQCPESFSRLPNVCNSLSPDIFIQILVSIHFTDYLLGELVSTSRHFISGDDFQITMTKMCNLVPRAFSSFKMAVGETPGVHSGQAQKTTSLPVFQTYTTRSSRYENDTKCPDKQNFAPIKLVDARYFILNTCSK